MSPDREYERVALTEADLRELQEALGNITMPKSPEEWERILATFGGHDAEAAQLRARLVRSQARILMRHGFEPGEGALGWDPHLGISIEGVRSN